MIPVQNIYYMLSYAFQALQEQGYQNLATEEFANTADLMAAILEKGVSAQIKKGLHREYVPQSEELALLRGKIDIAESVKRQTMLRKRLVCTYDEFSLDNSMNRILKSTMELLLRADLPRQRRRALKKLLLYFAEVESIDLRQADWNIRCERNDCSYQLLLSVCELAFRGLLQTTREGRTRLMDFLDEQRMCRLYEKFILEYYRKEFPQLTANAAQIPWQVNNGFRELLPVMQTDVMLTFQEKVLIIDAKYYEHTTQQRYGAYTLHSPNLYQIFTYVKNKEAELSGKPHKVAGMLLYAKTDEVLQPQHTYQMSGNQISVRTLDLNRPFPEIARQLNDIVSEYFKLNG